MSILSWDDFDEPEVATQKPVEAPKAPPPVQVEAVKPAPLVSSTFIKENTEILQQARTRLFKRNLTGGENSMLGGERITASDKRIILGTSDVNQLIPFKYDWAWQKFLDGCANHWMPTEISMQNDIAQWRSKILTEDERTMIMRSLGFFSTADTMVANNLMSAVFDNITAPECRQYLIRQAFEESLHAYSYQHIIESLSMDQGEVFNMYREVPSICAKMAWGLSHTDALSSIKLKDDPSVENIQRFVYHLAAYYGVVEGVFFYCGFAQLLSLGRRNLMSGTSEQIQYIARDESLHFNFGADLINQIKHEHPEIWTKDFQQSIIDMMIEGYLLEVDYIKDTLPKGILGMNIGMHSDYLQFIVNRRLAQYGIPQEVFPNATNPYPWMSEIIDLRKEKNFFETRKICGV